MCFSDILSGHAPCWKLHRVVSLPSTLLILFRVSCFQLVRCLSEAIIAPVPSDLTHLPVLPFRIFPNSVFLASCCPCTSIHAVVVCSCHQHVHLRPLSPFLPFHIPSPLPLFFYTVFTGFVIQFSSSLFLVLPPTRHLNWLLWLSGRCRV